VVIDGYYDPKTNSPLTNKCHYTCKTCLNEGERDDCLVCEDNYIKKDDVKDTEKSECLAVDGYYDDTTDKKANVCYSTCEACSFSSHNSCITCKNSDKMKLVNGECIPKDGFYITPTDPTDPQPCSENCLTCHESATHCTKCDATKKLMLDAATHECVCSIGFYIKEGTCVECMPECATCDNGDDCLKCKG